MLETGKDRETTGTAGRADGTHAREPQASGAAPGRHGGKGVPRSSYHLVGTIPSNSSGRRRTFRVQ